MVIYLCSVYWNTFKKIKNPSTYSRISNLFFFFLATFPESSAGLPMLYLLNHFWQDAPQLLDHWNSSATRVQWTPESKALALKYHSSLGWNVWPFCPFWASLTSDLAVCLSLFHFERLSVCSFSFWSLLKWPQTWPLVVPLVSPFQLTIWYHPDGSLLLHNFPCIRQPTFSLTKFIH